MKNQDLFLAQKPHGFSTHSPASNREGFCEYLGRKTQQRFLPCHRLDRDTSGALFLAKTKEVAASISECFEKHLVYKEYILISKSSKKLSKSVAVSGDIKKVSKHFVFSPLQNGNSTTQFEHMENFGEYQMWKAIPKTGKTHQIRLHARFLGIPILGDELYSGVKASRIYLHCFKMKIENLNIEHIVPVPKSFQLIDQLTQNESTWLVACERRKMQFDNFTFDSNCMRLIHKEDRYLQLDNYRGVLWFSDFHNQNRGQECIDFFEKFKQEFSWDHFLYRKMLNRGQDPDSKLRLASEGFPVSWVAQENAYDFILKSTQGQSAGIFLDQRDSRKWVLENAKEKKILNLFSYTSLFSLAAAVGGAKECISVDTSKASLDWSKENFKINNINSEAHLFFSMEAEKFLDSAIKKNSQFDIIVCDPPSFARNKSGVFKIESDLSRLIQKMWTCLSKKGHLYISSNFEGWDQQEFEKILIENVGKIADQQYLNTDYDYELPNRPRVLKCILIQKS